MHTFKILHLILISPKERGRIYFFIFYLTLYRLTFLTEISPFEHELIPAFQVSTIDFLNRSNCLFVILICDIL